MSKKERPQATNNKEFLSVQESMAYLDISRSYLYDLKDGKLKAYGLGGKTYFRKSDLDSLIKPK